MEDGISEEDFRNETYRQSFIGDVVDDKYEIIEPIKPTVLFSCPFKARQASIGRFVSVKMLQKGLSPEREEQIRQEAKKLGKIGKHPNLTTVYADGEHRGHLWIATEYIPGRDYEELEKDGVVFSLEDIVGAGICVSEALSYMHDHGIEHNDIDMRNILKRQGGDGSVLLDLGGRLTRDRDANDIYAVGKFLNSLIASGEDLDKRALARFRQIVNRASNCQYEKPHELRDALKRFSWWNMEKTRAIGVGISRRRFGQISIGAAMLLGLGLLGKREFEYRNSAAYLVEKRTRESTDDSERLTLLDKKLKYRLLDNNVRGWQEDQDLSNDEFLYATNEGRWFTIKQHHPYSGYFVGDLWEAYRVTGKREFMEWALKRADNFYFVKEDDLSLSASRFLYSHGMGVDLLPEGYLKNSSMRKTLQAAEKVASRYDPKLGFIQTYDNSPEKLEVSTMIYAVPILKWAYERTGKERYLNILNKHGKTALENCIRKDGFVGSARRTAIIDQVTGQLIDEVNSRGYAPTTTLARSQAQLISGLVDIYVVTKDGIFLDAARGAADYYIDRVEGASLMPGIPFLDFHHPRVLEASNGNISPREVGIPIDASAPIFTLHPFQKLSDFTGDSKYGDFSNEAKRTIITELLSPELEPYQGIVRGVCLRIGGSYENCSTAQAGYYFLRVLGEN